mmetsp:Transcript_72375/g.228129  ORF Transcript_72375/g.228129 Transcript_72375/m.228129 type:complete len:453 (+) Transcript_72375:991-2349(+)
MELEDVKEQVIRETQNARELLADASAAGAALRQAFEVMKNKALRFEEEIASLSNVREQQEEAEAFAAEAMRQVELSRAAAQASQERIAELEGAMRRQQAGPGAPSQELAQELEALEQESLMREAALGDLRVQSENTSRELKALQGALKAREFELDEVRRAAGRDRQRAEEELELARAEANKFSDELQALRKSTPAMDLTGLVEVDVLREAVAIGEGLSSRVEELEADVEAKRGELQQLMEKSSREAEEAQATLATALARAAGLDSQFRDLVGLLSKNMDGGGQAAVMAIQETLAAGSGAAVGFTAAAASTNGRARGQSDVAQRAQGAIDLLYDATMLLACDPEGSGPRESLESLSQLLAMDEEGARLAEELRGAEHVRDEALGLATAIACQLLQNERRQVTCSKLLQKSGRGRPSHQRELAGQWLECTAILGLAMAPLFEPSWNTACPIIQE